MEGQLSAAGIPKNYRKLFWREAFQTATLLDGLIMFEVEGKKLSRSSSLCKSFKEMGREQSCEIANKNAAKNL